ncbi:PREDICTED: WRKY transcription factor 6-like [Ipomoea nil]|uniref:WRKY transcription factor 6-like n=1 Tax=Ipomoea nil TaxID=35883 RepID=UPI0009011076|nr:PREDICTED: WRKY transcription factor 6-like [Ipomoea nil]
MDKGRGLTLENPDQRARFFTNKPVFGFNLSPRLNPIYASSSSAAGMPPNEVDFFSDKKADIVIKKEITLHGEPVTKADLNGNTGLQLAIANAGSNKSMVDDIVSSDMEERRANNDLSVLQVELEKMNAENQRLQGTTVPGPLQSHTSSEERTLSAGSPRNYTELSRHKGIAREDNPDSERWAPNKLPKLNSSKSVDQAIEVTVRKGKRNVVNSLREKRNKRE